MYLQYQNKWARVSVNSPQKEQESACFRPILKRKSFVAIRLWRNMNWNTRNFVSVVHRKGGGMYSPSSRSHFLLYFLDFKRGGGLFSIIDL